VGLTKAGTGNSLLHYASLGPPNVAEIYKTGACTRVVAAAAAEGSINSGGAMSCGHSAHVLCFAGLSSSATPPPRSPLLFLALLQCAST
jgi:hypothetical protein